MSSSVATAAVIKVGVCPCGWRLLFNRFPTIAFGIFLQLLYAVATGAVEPRFYEDEQGRLHVTGRDVYLGLDFNDSVFLGGIDLVNLARTVDVIWAGHPLNLDNAKLYSVGGWQGVGLVEAFDGKAWSPVPAIPTARGLLGTVVFQRQLYVIGGSNDNTDCNNVEAFDGFSWTIKESLPTARARLGVAAYNNRIFAAGGRVNDSEALSRVDTYNGVAWSPAPSMLTARFALGLVNFNNKLYAMGGTVDNVNGMDTVEAFDGIAWKVEASLPSPRYAFGASVFQHKVYIIGGRQTLAERTRSVDVYDGSTWSRGVPMSTARDWLGVAVYNGNLHAVGGWDGTSLTTIETFNGTVWSNLAPSMRTARYGHGVAVFPV